MKRIFTVGIIVTLFMATACNQQGGTTTEAKLTDTADQANAALPDKENTGKVIQSYIALKNELFKSDASAGKKAASALEDELIEVKGCAEAASMAREISATENIDDQRKAFLTLSKDIIPLAESLKGGAPLYVAFCPMADGGKGGYWLSEQEKIQNPYYGDAMAECGMVKKVIK